MGLRDRLAELRAKGMSQQEALMTAADEGLIDPRAVEKMLRVTTSADALASAAPTKMPEMVHTIRPDQVPEQPGNPGPRPTMPPSYSPSGAPTPPPMPRSWPPSAPPQPGMEALPSEDQRMLAKRRALLEMMAQGQQPQMDPGQLMALMGGK